MSNWTYIRGTVEVDVPGRTQAEIEYILKSVLNHLPRVKGSEGDMEVHIVKHDGHNCSSNCDEYGQRTNNLIDWRYGHKTNKGGCLQTQSNYTLTIIGDLRDTYFEETYKEFMKWLVRLSKRLPINNVLIRITNNRKTAIIDENNDKFYDLYECPSWIGTNEIAWWEHLFWDNFENYYLPKSLMEKYYPEYLSDDKE